jgi:hypothetical protein
MGPELPPGGGDHIVAGDTFSAASPTQRDWQQAWDEGGNIPRAITQNDALDIQSNISLGEGYDQWIRGEGEAPEQRPADDARGGGITTVLKSTSGRMTDATIEQELEWQAQVGGDSTKSMAFKDQVLNQQAF